MCLMAVLIAFTSRGVRRRCRNYFTGRGGGARNGVHAARRGGMEVSPRRGDREVCPRRGCREVSRAARRGGMEARPDTNYLISINTCGVGRVISHTSGGVGEASRLINSIVGVEPVFPNYSQIMKQQKA